MDYAWTYQLSHSSGKLHRFHEGQFIITRKGKIINCNGEFFASLSRGAFLDDARGYFGVARSAQRNVSINLRVRGNDICTVEREDPIESTSRRLQTGATRDQGRRERRVRNLV
ncbi:unnamed protein product [Trichogramma brassicae]|uniref:Uncharacterized protein n=1 Tax=Trichogramma brassicae TaxID=86971 RepID=A0A6H5I703_9HYME|nr:unnamed protein product [Trichogramma brassicae]